jgi:hypothetical protein
MTRARGDLVLYQSSGRWYERMIALATKGPFIHVAIVVDPLTVIAARTRVGISYERIPPEDALHATIPLAGRTTPAGIEQGLTWACAQRGKAYGWPDIVYQALKFLWPDNPFRFGVAGHYDCSDFATRYMIHAGVSLPDAMLDTYTVSPNDLARWSGLLPEKDGSS